MSAIIVSRSERRVADLIVISEIVSDASMELVVAIGLTCTRSETPALRHPRRLQDLCCFIGFVGTDLSGSLAVRAPYCFAERSHPLRKSMLITEADAHDWFSELTNQLMGRVKNHCVRKGLDFSVGVPRVAAGTAMELVPARNVHSLQQCLIVSVGGDDLAIDVSFDLVVDDDTTLWSLVPQTAEQEGSLIMFNEEEPV